MNRAGLMGAAFDLMAQLDPFLLKRSNGRTISFSIVENRTFRPKRGLPPQRLQSDWSSEAAFFRKDVVPCEPPLAARRNKVINEYGS